jgi:hypothetical protein
MLILTSERLHVEIDEPFEGSNTGFRFDRAGYVSEVVLDGGMRFCASEPRNLRHPSSGGRGFCNEYRFNICEDTETGEYFPKFGIGLIRKEDDEKYIFYKKYRDVVPFKVTVKKEPSRAVFITEPMPCQGFALRTVKTVSLSENAMTMTILAENSGDKALTIEEFCHNFISIDGMAVGSDYRLELPQCPDLGYGRLRNRSGNRQGSMRGNGKGVTFCEFSAIDTDFAVDTAHIADQVPFTWKMSHLGARAFVECEEGFKPAGIALWAVDHIFSPEIINEFTLEPGKSTEYSRRWRFETFCNDSVMA